LKNTEISEQTFEWMYKLVVKNMEKHYDSVDCNIRSLSIHLQKF